MPASSRAGAQAPAARAGNHHAISAGVAIAGAITAVPTTTTAISAAGAVTAATTPAAVGGENRPQWRRRCEGGHVPSAPLAAQTAHLTGRGRVRSVQRWETEVMGPIDKKLKTEVKEVKEGKIPKPIEDLPSEWAKEDREIEGAKPDLAEVEEDPSEL